MMTNRAWGIGCPERSVTRPETNLGPLKITADVIDNAIQDKTSESAASKAEDKIAAG